MLRIDFTCSTLSLWHDVSFGTAPGLWLGRYDETINQVIQDQGIQVQAGDQMFLLVEELVNIHR